MRHEILSLDEVERAVGVAREASFLDRAPTIDSSVTGRDGGARSARADPRRSRPLGPYTPAVSSIWRPVRERAPARSLMVVVAHPGDESFGFGGAIASAAADGAYVVVVCVTRGWFDARLVRRVARAGRQEPRREARRRHLAQPRHGARGRAAPIRRPARRSRGPHARLQRGRPRPRRLRPPGRAHRRADPHASAGGDPHLRPGRHHRRPRPRRAVAGGDGRLPAGRPAARARGRSRGGPGRVAGREALSPRGAQRARDVDARRPGAGGGIRLATRRRPSRSSSARWHSSSWRRSAATSRRPGRPGPFHDWDPATREAWLATEHYRLAASAVSAPGTPESSLFEGLA